MGNNRHLRRCVFVTEGGALLGWLLKLKSFKRGSSEGYPFFRRLQIPPKPGSLPRRINLLGRQ
jgi:hypothetical protein